MNQIATHDNEKELRIYRSENVVFSTIIDKPLEVGRQRSGEKWTLRRIPGTDVDRVIIAPIQDSEISRAQLLVEPYDGHSVRLTNISQTRAVVLEHGRELRPGAKVIVNDICLKLANINLHIRIPTLGDGGFHITSIEPGYDLGKTIGNLVSSVRQLDRVLDDSQKEGLLSGLSLFELPLRQRHESFRKSANSLLESLSVFVGLDHLAIYEIQNGNHQPICQVGQTSVLSTDPDSVNLRNYSLNQRELIVSNPKGFQAGSVPSRFAVPVPDTTGHLAIFYAERINSAAGDDFQPHIAPFEPRVFEVLARIYWPEIRSVGLAEAKTWSVSGLLKTLFGV